MLIAITLFARSKDSTILENDTFILYCMEKGIKINVGSFFANYILKLANKNNKKIIVGSFVTKIARSLITNFSTNGLTHACFPEAIELYYLEKFGVCRKVDEVYYLEQIAKAILEEQRKAAEKRKRDQERKATSVYKRRKVVQKTTTTKEGKKVAEKSKFLERCENMNFRKLLGVVEQLWEAKEDYLSFKIEVDSRIRRLEDDNLDLNLPSYIKKTPTEEMGGKFSPSHVPSASSTQESEHQSKSKESPEEEANQTPPSQEKYFLEAV